jgi:hypothetical protein
MHHAVNPAFHRKDVAMIVDELDLNIRDETTPI